MAVFSYHKPLSSLDHFAWKFWVLELGHWPTVFTLKLVVILLKLLVVRLITYYCKITGDFRDFLCLIFFSFISLIISSGRFERVNLKRKSSFKDLMNSSFIAFKCDQRTTNKMNACKTWGKQITTNFMVKTRRYSTFEFVYAKFPDDPMMTIGYGANIMPCFVGYQKRKNLS